MHQQTIVWTVLPRGYVFDDIERLAFDVHVAPRLVPMQGTTPVDGRLAQFPDFAPWVPPAADRVTFTLVVRIGATLHRSPCRIKDPSLPLPEYWPTLLPPTTAITPRTADAVIRRTDTGNRFDEHQVVSYPMLSVAEILAEAYGTAANLALEGLTPEGGPAEHIGRDLLGEKEGGLRLGRFAFGLRENGEDRVVGPGLERIANQRAQPGAGGRPARANDFGSGPFTGGDAAQHQMLALREFHQPARTWPEGDGPNNHPVRPPSPDFHQLLAAAGAHGKLLQALGLTVNVQAGPSDFTPSLPRLSIGTQVDAWVEVDYRPKADVGNRNVTYRQVTPMTRCVLSPSAFHAVSLGGAIQDGHVRVGDPTRYGIVQVDPDGGALGLINTATTLATTAAKPAPDTPAGSTLPELRSHGFAVVKRGRGLDLVASIDRSVANNTAMEAAAVAFAANPVSAPGPRLYAEDLTRGYVLDVHQDGDDPTRWRSTARRQGYYIVPGHPDPDLRAFQLRDEGFTELVPTSKSLNQGDTDDRVLRVPESVLRWNGWSLTVPPPGIAIRPDDGIDPGQTLPTDPPSGPDLDPVPDNLKVRFRFQAIGLPRLRYGTTYRFRMRTRDIAGGGTSPDEGVPATDAARVTPPQTYLRHEPVRSPDILELNDFAPGEGTLTLVIRGNHDADSTDVSARLLAPPRIPQLMAEQHGFFDKEGDGSRTVDPDAYDLIADRESAPFAARDAAGKRLPLDARNPVPYLPDPLSRGARISPTGGLSARPVVLPLEPAPGARWPEYRPAVIELRHGGAPAWTPPTGDDRTLRVQLGKADRMRVRISSAIQGPRTRPDAVRRDVQLLGVTELLRRRYPGTPAVLPERVLDTLAAGVHWMATPWREVELVYAVRQPLEVPRITRMEIRRAEGDVDAGLVATIAVSKKSSGRIEVLSRWNEPVDGGPGAPEPSGPGAPTTTGRDVAHLAGVVPTGRIARETEPDAVITRDEREQPIRELFGDHKRRDVEYRIRATTPFTEFFAGSRTVEGASGPLSPVGFEVGSVTVTAANGLRVAPGSYTVDHAAGTVTVPAALGKMTVAWLPPVSRMSDEGGPASPSPEQVRRMVVPASARPDVPEIVEILPIFRWDGASTARGTKVTSRRSAARMRVYLARPWWSSGAGELLGVVTMPPTDNPSPPDINDTPNQKPPTVYNAASREALRGGVTQWGEDTVFASAKLPSFYPSPKSFPLATLTAANQALPGNEKIKVAVAGHAVAYDAERKLWYADIAVDSGTTYNPFVRFAFARFQPEAVDELNLSRVVQAQYLQLAPGRAAGVVVDNAKHTVTVTLTGPSYTSSGAKTKRGYARALIERRDKGLGDDVAGWVQVGGHVDLRSTLSGRPNLVTWRGTKKLPAAKGPFRLVIEQYEELGAEDQRPRTGKPGPAGAVTRRLVHSDVIPLPAARPSPAPKVAKTTTKRPLRRP